MTGPPSEPETVNSGTMTNLSSANINKLQENKEKLSIELQKKISNFTEQTKTLSVVEANSQDTKNKLTKLTAERNAALNGLAKYSKKLAEVMNSKKANAKTISGLENNLAELQGISNATKKELSAQIKQLEQNRNSAVALVNQLESNKAELSNLVGKFQQEISNSKISNAELKTKLTTILSQRNSIQQKLNESIKKGALTQQEINNLRKSTSKERESLLAQVRNAQEILKRLQNEKKEKNQKNAALVALKTNLNKILSLNKIASYKINNKYKNNDNFKRAVTSRKSTLESIEKAKEDAVAERRRKAAIAAAAVAAAAAAARQTALSSFKAKVMSAKVTIQNKRLNQLATNANNPNANLAKLETRFADIAGKPRIYLFLNKVVGKNLPNYAQLNGIKTFTAGDKKVANAVNTMKKIVSEYTSIIPKKNLNLFFIGPSGSGKTFLFSKYLDKNVAGNVTAYYPTFNYNLESGILTISDTSKKMPYSTFVEDFIHPTPFNKTSSRAHMSYQNGDVTMFDLAGTENPMAIMYKSLGYNIFETKYWAKFSSASVSDILKRGPTQKEVKELLIELGLINRNQIDKQIEKKTYNINLCGLDEMVFLYVYWNYINKETKPGDKANSIAKIIEMKSGDKAKINMMVGVFNNIKRVFEGFWITRSLHALNLLFTKNEYKNLASKTETKLIGTNTRQGFQIQIKELVKGKYQNSNFVKQLGGISNNQSANFIILNKTNPSYKTNFVTGLLNSGNNNCLFGVVNAQSKFPEQRQAAIDYLQSLQK